MPASPRRCARPHVRAAVRSSTCDLLGNGTDRRIRHTCFAGRKQRRQPGGTGGQGQRCFDRRAAALEDVKRERVHPFHQQPQTRRRSIVARIQAAEDEQQAPLCCWARHLQAPQLGAFGLGQPGKHGRHFGATQRLFGGPQPGGGLFGAHAQQPLGRQALRLQAGPEGLMRCAHQDHRPRLPAIACASAGNTSCQTCCPARCCNTSTMLPTGQPPPGNCASRAAWPVGSTAPSVARSSTRQT